MSGQKKGRIVEKWPVYELYVKSIVVTGFLNRKRVSRVSGVHKFSSNEIDILRAWDLFDRSRG
jgi:hypothetical protein